MSIPARRSARERKRNPKYATVAWDKDTIRTLRASSESSGSSPEQDFVAEEGDSAEIIQENDHFAVSEDDAFSTRSASSQTSEAAVSNEDFDNDDDHNSSGDDDEHNTQIKSRSKPPRTRATDPLITNDNASTAHSRGVARDIPKSAPKESVYHDTYGPCMDDLAHVLQARDTWLKGRDITIPSRKTLSEAARFSAQNSDLSSSDVEAPFLDDHIFKSLTDRQSLQNISNEYLQNRYLANEQRPHLAFMGPYGEEQKFDLAHGASFDFGKVWRKQVGDPQSYHNGWILNLGEKVQSVSWAPSNTPDQYLAVACRSTSTQRGSSPEQNPGAPAFSASSPYPSNIQIWKFTTKETRFPGLYTLDMTQRPTLAMVIATDWGENHQIIWHPRENLTNLQEHAHVNGAEFCGILGILSSDGCARLISISILSDASRSQPVNVRALGAGYEIPPPKGTIFTTFSFATPSDIILGATDGSIHLFDLTESTHHNEPPASFLSYALHSTYVIAVRAASPSPLAHFVSSVSASGDLVLVDLRSPEQDQISIHRSCFPNRDLVYSPLTRSFITALDRAGNTHIDSGTSTYIMCYHLRQFHVSHRVAKMPDYGGTATALAASPWHPCILASNARGTVVATNFLRKVLPQTRKDLPKAKSTTGAYLQKICEYDWRPLTEDELREVGIELSHADRAKFDGPPQNLYHGRDVRPGASRFSEGFKPERIHVGHPTGTRKELAKLQELGAAEATFEDEQAVTVMEWNVNRHCAGLVALGWGSGLLRVQDLAHDLE
ncbi:hypothetical protein LTR84_010145 [Exophiala bonariae]|uniref:Uncharacterized protein n=1 Tax=Exophiala bonariae TaxID=1690606 RepID=A0AAV9MWA6_9EURO|nr:hypothetical protein LTR84_010145 [Exophiala bonariae]